MSSRTNAQCTDKKTKGTQPMPIPTYSRRETCKYHAGFGQGAQMAMPTPTAAKNQYNAT